MTEESDDEVEGVVRRHQLSWASDELQELKATLDQRILEADTISGRFRCKSKVDSTLSALPPPLQPVQWAVVQQDEGRREYDDHYLEHDEMDTTDIINSSGHMIEFPDDTELRITPTRSGRSSNNSSGSSSRSNPARSNPGIPGRRLVDLITSTPQ
ncbi:uncharacterized protein [Dysidea avara]|uniref:uncharacterized protein n=1 Tax=Dysidea avara TaxID=196820 RepID=UPI003316716E